MLLVLWCWVFARVPIISRPVKGVSNEWEVNEVM